MKLLNHAREKGQGAVTPTPTAVRRAFRRLWGTQGGTDDAIFLRHPQNKESLTWLLCFKNQDSQWYSVENSTRVYWVKGCMSISQAVVAHTAETVRKGSTSILFCEVCKLQGSLSTKRLDLPSAQELKKYLSWFKEMQRGNSKEPQEHPVKCTQM